MATLFAVSVLGCSAGARGTVNAPTCTLPRAPTPAEQHRLATFLERNPVVPEMVQQLEKRGWGTDEARYFPPTAGGVVVMLEAAQTVYPDLFRTPGRLFMDWFEGLGVRNSLLPNEETSASADALLCAPPCLYDRAALLGPSRFRRESGVFTSPRTRAEDEEEWQNVWEAGALTQRCESASAPNSVAFVALDLLLQSLQLTHQDPYPIVERLLSARPRTLETTGLLLHYATTDCTRGQHLFERLDLPARKGDSYFLIPAVCPPSNRFDLHPHIYQELGLPHPNNQNMSFTQHQTSR